MDKCGYETNFIHALVTALLTMSSLFMNQQCILNEVSINKHLKQGDMLICLPVSGEK